MKYIPLFVALVGASGAFASRALPALLHKVGSRAAVAASSAVTDKLRYGLGVTAIVIACGSMGCSLAESLAESKGHSREARSSARAGLRDEARAAEQERAQQRIKRRRERLGARYEGRYGDPRPRRGIYTPGETYRARSGDDLAMEGLGGLSIPMRRYGAGDHVYFVSDDVARSGTLQKYLGNSRYLVKIDSAGYARSTATVSGHDIIAAYRPSEDEQSFEGANVLVASDSKRVKYRHGTILRFYDDGYVEIRVERETWTDGTQVVLRRSYTVFVDGSLSRAEGGFELGDAF